jgi:hypothetical protein
MIGSDTQRANSMLLKLFLSDLRLRIAKCVSCNVYFVLQRVSTYKSGTRCKECRAARRISTAIASTTLGRTEAERELYGLAAAHFRRVITNNAEWHESDKVRRNMIEYLNGKILKSEKLSSIYYAPPRSGLTTKWLARARNRDGIMAAFRAAGVE